MAAAAAVLVLLTSACTLRKSYGVATHTDPVSGNCDHSRVVEVGAALDLSGPDGNLGHRYLLGLQQAVHQIDSTGGILKNHSCLELLYKDDRGDARIGDQAVLDLVDNEVVTFLVAPFESATIRAAGADLGLAGVPTVGLSPLDETGGPKNYPMLFPVVPSASVTAGTLAAYATAQHWTSVAVTGRDDAAGRQEVTDLRRALSASRVTLSSSDYTASVPGPAGGSPGPRLFVGGDEAMGTAGAVGNDGVGVVMVPKGAAPDASRLATAAAYDGIQMLAYAAGSQNSTRAGDVRTFLENATYQGVLGVYGYSADHHTGLAANQLALAPAAAGGSTG